MIDLTNWKLTLPDKTPPTEIKPPQLANWSHPDWFIRGEKGELIFITPTNGGHTMGSSYPRTELRELIDGASDRVNWRLTNRHSLVGECVVNKVPPSKKVIIAQIHGKEGTSAPLFKLVYNNGKLVGEFKKSITDLTDTKLDFGSLSTGKKITYSLELDGLNVVLKVNGKTKKIKLDSSWLVGTYYFKAGNYCIDNSGKGYSQVTYYQLVAKHS
jgi:hypothetical protein